MSYPATARRFVAAELSTRHGAAPDPATLAADKLPMSAKAEDRRAAMTPATIAHHHAARVMVLAEGLRHALMFQAQSDRECMVTQDEAAQLVSEYARALLAAIGEGEA